MPKTFLTLCNDLQRESGTVTMRQPIADVTAVTGRQEKVVAWVRDAYFHIQTLRPDWKWLRADFTAQTTAGQAAYDGGASGWAISRFSRFCEDGALESPHTIYDGTNVNESELRQISPEFWRQCYGRGAQTQQRPTEYALDGSLMLFGAIPDKAYTVRGRFVRTPQILAANGDTPEMPGDFHDIIVFKAMEAMGAHDQDATLIGNGQARWKALYSDMMNATAGRMG